LPKEEAKGEPVIEQIDTSKHLEIQPEKIPSDSIKLNPNLRLSSLDLTAYAYLKEL